MAKYIRKHTPLLGHWAMLVADNGEPVATTTRYGSEAELAAALADLTAYRHVADVRSHWRPWGKRWTFVLDAGSARVYSEPYWSEYAARRGVEDALRAARDAT